MQRFLTTLLLAGSAVALPTLSITSRSDNDSCMAKGTKVTAWTIKDFDFHASYTFTNPAHQNSWGYANFTLENPVLDYKPICSASSNQLEDFFYGTQIFECDAPVDGDSATFTFSRPTGELQVNQTWQCLEQGGRFHAKGGVTLDLDCEDTTWKNPEWEEGQIYSQRTITCAKKTVSAPITEISAVL
ncbi:Fc.00g083310.m01.CDS01 [Cosmosporella sp. VM-42]